MVIDHLGIINQQMSLSDWVGIELMALWFKQ